MYYVNYPIKLIVRLQGYLELIQRVNNYREGKRADLAIYDNLNQWQKNIAFTTRWELVEGMERWENLSNWLALRMQSVLMELNQENNKQLRKILSDEVQTIEL